MSLYNHLGHMRHLLLPLLLASLHLGAAEAEVAIFAAASTTDAVTAVATAYEAEHHVRIVTCFASSATLAKQIEQGAPADLFLSADTTWMDHLAKKNAIVPASRTDLLGNELVLIAPAAKPLAVRAEKGFDLAGTFTGRLAIGDPASVPAGIYAKESFTALGWWEALRSRLSPTADVRAALKLVELGEVDLGVVYATDAKANPRVTVVAVLPGGTHTPIRYPVALTVTARPAAAAFLAHLRGPQAREVYARAGFSDPAAE